MLRLHSNIGVVSLILAQCLKGAEVMQFLINNSYQPTKLKIYTSQL